MTHPTDPNGVPGDQKFFALGAKEPKKTPKLNFFKIFKIRLIAISAPLEIILWGNDPSK